MRRFGTAVVTVVMAMVLAGCGRQVTGLSNPNAGQIVPAGKTLIRFETAAQPDFSRYSYVIALNTSGNGQEPLALGYAGASFPNWSYAIVIGSQAPNSISQPYITQIFQQPGTSSGYAQRPILYPQNFVAAPNLNIAATIAPGGFEITFNRCIFDNPPATSATGAAVSPNATAICPPFTYSKPVWNINIFTVDNTGSVVDSLGNNGPQDPSVFFQVDTSSVQDVTQRKTIVVTVPDKAAQIYGLEVISTP